MLASKRAPIREESRVVFSAGILKRHIWQLTNLSSLGILRVCRLSNRGVWNPLAAGASGSKCHVLSRRKERDEERNVTACSVANQQERHGTWGEEHLHWSSSRVWNVEHTKIPILGGFGRYDPEIGKSDGTHRSRCGRD